MTKVYVFKTQMIGANWQVYTAYVAATSILDPNFGTIYGRSEKPVDGHKYFGQVGTYSCLPKRLKDMPARTISRSQAVLSWQFKQEIKSRALIYLAYPELRNMEHRVSGYNVDTFEPRPKGYPDEYRVITVDDAIIPTGR